MRSEPTEQPVWWTGVPSDQVVRIDGITRDELALEFDPLPSDAPVVISYSLAKAESPGQVVADILDGLENVAIRLFPAWLPDADVVTTNSGFDRRVVRMLARRLAAQSEHFGPFLADIADAALRGASPVARFAPETRLRGLATVLADVYERDHFVLAVDGSGELDDVEQQSSAAAFSWLADHGIGVWLTDGVLPSVNRFVTVVVSAPPTLRSSVLSAAPRPLDIPPPVGMPHPLSEIEQRMAHALTQAEWAYGHQWNQPWTARPLAPSIRVDLVWPAERCVVELDGPDHRRADKYADDRNRDNGLALAGFRVLRFTNEQVASDLPSVLAIINSMLTQLRTERNHQ